MSFIAKQHWYIDPAKVFVDGTQPVHGTTKEHLNSTLLPTDVNAATEFTYLVTDGSDDGIAYLKAPAEDGL